ncbi:MAG: Rqc2 family fibronectin-binding protein, partial [Microcystaceae cyanobacterium]
MQSVDFTTLVAIALELRSRWLPARIEQVYQRDRHTISLALRTLNQRGWLTLCWHPQAARLGMEDAPPRSPDTFTFSDQLRHQLAGFALTGIELIAPWERVIDLQIAQRPGETPRWHLYIEIMGKYSNVILTDGDQQIITVAHQVNAQQSRIRTVQTGQPYQIPPALLATAPSLDESFQRWRERLSLIPGSLQKQWVKTDRGLSPVVARSLIASVELDANTSNENLSPENWQKLFTAWQNWLKTIETGDFQPAWTESGYTVLGYGGLETAPDVQTLIFRYYRDRLGEENFTQLRHQLLQKVQNRWQKLQQKAQTLRDRLGQSDQAEDYRNQADLLMANLQEWQAGMGEIWLADFTTGEPVKIFLAPEKNAIQNAQAFYKK